MVCLELFYLKPDLINHWLLPALRIRYQPHHIPCYLKELQNDIPVNIEYHLFPHAIADRTAKDRANQFQK